MGENTVMLTKGIKKICAYNHAEKRKDKRRQEGKSLRPEVAQARALRDAHRLQIYQHAQCWGGKTS